MDITSVYTTATLASMKASNDDYIANKTMYRELNTIRLKVLGQNNLGLKVFNYDFNYNNNNKTVSYYDTMVTMLQSMFTDTSISKVNNVDNTAGTISFNWS
jgi:NADH/NAD ratio-sensing transcriptional regulator Rex